MVSDIRVPGGWVRFVPDRGGVKTIFQHHPPKPPTRAEVIEACAMDHIHNQLNHWTEILHDLRREQRAFARDIRRLNAIPPWEDFLYRSQTYRLPTNLDLRMRYDPPTMRFDHNYSGVKYVAPDKKERNPIPMLMFALGLLVATALWIIVGYAMSR